MPASSREGADPAGITGISVEGFKSFYEKQSIEIRPLTVLAGVNSSGKSSIMQPLLLLKQTLESPYDPGPLLLDGPNVSVTRIEQVLSRGEGGQAAEFGVGISVSIPVSGDILLRFGRGGASGAVRIRNSVLNFGRGDALSIYEGMAQSEIESLLPASAMKQLRRAVAPDGDAEVSVTRSRWSLSLEISRRGDKSGARLVIPGGGFDSEEAVSQVIHLPALRGNPRRTYRTAAVEDAYPGVFNDYTAGVIAVWQNTSQEEKLARLRADLELLGLASTVEARQLDDSSVELLVSRTPKSRKNEPGDLVNIADVGFGVSQTLPVVLALQVAAPGQLVYLEQPEIHLHPRAQAAFAELLRAAVERGARVVVETHSALLIRAIQTMVAKRELDKENVALHWFSRHPETGMSTIASATMDQFGAFGDWPEDFDEVNLQADHDYLTAVEDAEAEAGSQ